MVMVMVRVRIRFMVMVMVRVRILTSTRAILGTVLTLTPPSSPPSRIKFSARVQG